MESLQNYFSLFFVSFMITFSGALVPGPLLAGVMYESAHRGFRAGPLMILGHGLVEIVMIAIILFGINHFISNPIVLKAISLFGALVMLYFGINMLLSIPRLSWDIEIKKDKSANLVLQGMTLSVGNPYWTIWWLTIGLGLVLSARDAGLVAIVMFFTGHILADLGWYSIISASVARGHKFFPLKVYKGLVIILGIFLIFFGIYFGIQPFSLNFARKL